jgi:class 3 adenylate cyclase/HAMP domain-containing protein
MKNISFSFKITLAILLISSAAIATSFYFTYDQSHSFLVGQMQSRLIQIGRAGTQLITDEDRENLTKLTKEMRSKLAHYSLAELQEKATAGEYFQGLEPEDILRYENSDTFKKMVQVLRKIKLSTQTVAYPAEIIDQKWDKISSEPDLKYAYILGTLGKDPENKFTFIIADSDWEGDDGITPGIIFNAGKNAKLREAFSGEESAETTFVDEAFGKLLNAGIPIKNNRGNVIAILGLDISASGSANKLDDLFWRSISILGFALVFSLVIGSVLARRLVKPVKLLKEGAEKVRERDFSVDINVHTGDEFKTLAESFNEMVKSIESFTTEIETINKAYYRFVPQQFLQNLERDSIKQVIIGDHVEKELSVLFSDIRSFTSISEAMSPQENFEFINEYMSKMTPQISNNDGFIDKFIGDAIMALFPAGAENAVKGGVGMLNALALHNKDRAAKGNPALEIGIGIHTGSSMMGTVGSPERIQATVFSNTVSFADRLEGLSKTFGAQLLISENTYKRLESMYDTRYLGPIPVSGTDKGMGVYEIILDHLPNAEHKIRTKTKFEKAMDLFLSGNVEKAKPLFKEVLRANRNDKAAFIYLAKCLKYKKGDPLIVNV